MTDGSQFIDIILFAMVAVFLGLRLRSVLGRRTGHEQSPPDFAARPGPNPNNVIDIAKRRRDTEPVIIDADQPATIGGLAEIQRADPNFTPEAFLQGAEAAFEMIVSAFAKGDQNSLRPLLSDEVYENFSHAIEARRTASETSQSELLRIISADIQDSRVEGRVATISVRFVSEQMIVIKNAEGAVIEGNSSRATKIIDLWSFSRDTRATNPNWLLVATRSLEE
jgi:predicted lipid-binding transport protein (Tim44 family)